MSAAASAPIRLCLMSEALDCDGQPRAALVLPAKPAEGNEPGRRAVTLLFGTIGAAVAAKRAMEGPA